MILGFVRLIERRQNCWVKVNIDRMNKGCRKHN